MSCSLRPIFVTDLIKTLSQLVVAKWFVRSKRDELKIRRNYSIKKKIGSTILRIGQREVMIEIKIEFNEQPCIRLARGKFELTNQDSAGGKNSSVLTSS